jgi:serine protease
LVIFSSGNNGGAIQYPANHPKVIAVGASDSLDQWWYYSSYGSDLDVVAPSADTAQPWGNFWILDTPGMGGYNNGPHGCGGVDPDYNCKFAGTSAACPQVSGIAALILLRRPDLRSVWWNNHTEQMREIIRYSSERAQFDTLAPPDDTSRVDDYVGWGRVNADRALMAVVRGDNDNDGHVDITDARYLIAYISDGGPAPQPHKGVADANCDGSVDISDVVYLIAYIFSGGQPPKICYHYTYN